MLEAAISGPSGAPDVGRVEDSSCCVIFPCMAIIALSPWARFPGAIEMSLNGERIVAGCSCGFGKACSGIFV